MMNIPESKEVIIQRISKDERVVSLLVKDLVMGLVDIPEEFRIAAEVCRDYEVGIEIFSRGCDLARDEIDQAILDGRATLL